MTVVFSVSTYVHIVKNSDYRVALNVCGGLILRIGDFLCFAGTIFGDWKRLVFLLGINFCHFLEVAFK